MSKCGDEMSKNGQNVKTEWKKRQFRVKNLKRRLKRQKEDIKKSQE